MDVLIAGYRISRLRDGSGGTYDDVLSGHCFTIAAATFHLLHYCFTALNSL